MCCRTRRAGPLPARRASAGAWRFGGAAPGPCAPRLPLRAARPAPAPSLMRCAADPRARPRQGLFRRRFIPAPAVARVAVFSAPVGGLRSPPHRPQPPDPPPAHRRAVSGYAVHPAHVLPGGTGRAGRGYGPQAPEAGDVPRGRLAPATPFPPSVFPLWKPPFLIPPSCGSRQRGQTAGGHGAASSTPTQRRPSGCRGQPAACPPPLRRSPRRGGRVGRAGARLRLSPPRPPLPGRRFRAALSPW